MSGKLSFEKDQNVKTIVECDCKNLKNRHLHLSTVILN